MGDRIEAALTVKGTRICKMVDGANWFRCKLNAFFPADRSPFPPFTAPLDNLFSLEECSLCGPSTWQVRCVSLLFVGKEHFLWSWEKFDWVHKQ